jgi:hypothetical protein
VRLVAVGGQLAPKLLADQQHQEINEFQQQERGRVDSDRLDIVSNTVTVEALKKAVEPSGNWP